VAANEPNEKKENINDEKGGNTGENKGGGIKGEKKNY